MLTSDLPYLNCHLEFLLLTFLITRLKSSLIIAAAIKFYRADNEFQSKLKIAVKIHISAQHLHVHVMRNIQSHDRNSLDYVNIFSFLLFFVCVRHSNVDMIIIREQTEGEYTSLEHEVWLCFLFYSPGIMVL